MNDEINFDEILAEAQKEFFQEGYGSPAETLGIIVSHWADYDGEEIVKVFLAALEDSNFHTFGARVEDMFYNDPTARGMLDDREQA